MHKDSLNRGKGKYVEGERIFVEQFNFKFSTAPFSAFLLGNTS